MSPQRLPRRFTSLAVAALAASCVLAQAPHPSQDLGSFPGATGSTFGTGSSADGTVISATVYPSGANERALRWTPLGGFTDMGLPANLPSSARAVSSDGRFVVGRLGDDAFRWSEALGVELLNAPNTGTYTATSVSADGSVIVGSWRPIGSGIEVLFRWTAASGIQNLGNLNGNPIVGAAVSGDGNVIYGHGVDSAFDAYSCQWTAATGLLPFAGSQGPGTAVLATDADGTAVVGELEGSVPRAFRWSQTGGLQFLPTSAPGATSARAVSADGRVIAGSQVLSFVQEPCLWIDGDGPLFLDRLPGDSSALLASISADGSFAVGASLRSGSGYRAFRALVSPRGDRYCGPGVANSTGRSGGLVITGNESATAGSLSLRAVYLPQQALGFFLTSRSAGFPVQPPGSQGVICLGASIGRFVGPGQAQSSGSTGTIELAIDLQALPTPLGPVSGMGAETWYFQAWFRDQSPQGVMSNFTDAIGVTLN